MDDVPATKTDTYIASRYDIDPYASFANEGGPGIVGQRLACTKGEWVAGPDQTPVPIGTPMLAIVPTASRGWVRFGPDGITGADVGLVAEGFKVKHRFALGDNDEGQWTAGPDGEPRDPWAVYFSVQLVQMSPPHGDLTFTSNSHGGRLALQDLCGTYAADRHLHEGQFPVVTIEVNSRRTKYGQVKGPRFGVVGWASIEDVRAGRKAPKAKQQLKAKPQSDEVRWRED